MFHSLQEPSDNELMLKVRSGDLDQLGELYERYKKRLFGFFYKLNKDKKLSEDLVQDVFIRILKYRHTYSDKSSFVSWIFRLARNINYDYHKRNKHLNKTIDLTSSEFKIEGQIEIQQKQNEDLKQLQIAFDKLSLKKKEILILSKFKELKFREVGEIMGCSEGAAKVMAHRALKDLRKIYLDQESK